MNLYWVREPDSFFNVCRDWAWRDLSRLLDARVFLGEMVGWISFLHSMVAMIGQPRLMRWRPRWCFWSLWLPNLICLIIYSEIYVAHQGCSSFLPCPIYRYIWVALAECCFPTHRPPPRLQQVDSQLAIPPITKCSHSERFDCRLQSYTFIFLVSWHSRLNRVWSLQFCFVFLAILDHRFLVGLSLLYFQQFLVAACCSPLLNLLFNFECIVWVYRF